MFVFFDTDPMPDLDTITILHLLQHDLWGSADADLDIADVLRRIVGAQGPGDSIDVADLVSQDS